LGCFGVYRLKEHGKVKFLLDQGAEKMDASEEEIDGVPLDGFDVALLLLLVALEVTEMGGSDSLACGRAIEARGWQDYPNAAATTKRA